MKSNFDACLAHVLRSEGGYVDNPRDPGGATNLGITFAVLKAWRNSPITKADVRRLTKEEASSIYRAQYWNPIQGDELPKGLDLAVFDYAVNSGVGTAAKALQTILRLKPDGHIGLLTLAAARKIQAPVLATSLCDYRLSFLQRLKTWKVFGRGWNTRVQDVAITARMMGR